MDIDVFFEDNLKVGAQMGIHTVITDQPVSRGGDNTAPAPFDMFLISIATCAGIMLKSFCVQRKISTDGFSIKQKHVMDETSHMVAKIVIEVGFPEGFPEKYKPIIKNVIDQCPVKKHLANPPEFEIVT